MAEIDSEERAANDEFAVGMRVRVHAGEIAESRGTVVEDFGAGVGIPVMVGTVEVTSPARRWAVALDSGELKCLDSDQLTRE